MGRKTAEPHPYLVPNEGLLTHAAGILAAHVHLCGLDHAFPTQWQSAAFRDVMRGVLTSLLHHNVQGTPIHLATAEEYRDAVHEADHRHDHYREWWAGAQVERDRQAVRFRDALDELAGTDRALAERVAAKAGLLLTPISETVPS
jgi:hypothetical protein